MADLPERPGALPRRTGGGAPGATTAVLVVGAALVAGFAVAAARPSAWPAALVVAAAALVLGAGVATARGRRVGAGATSRPADEGGAGDDAGDADARSPVADAAPTGAGSGGGGDAGAWGDAACGVEPQAGADGAAAAPGGAGAAAALVAALRAPAAVLDHPGGHLVAANPGMAERLGRGPDEVAGAPAGTVAFPDPAPVGGGVGDGPGGDVGDGAGGGGPPGDECADQAAGAAGAADPARLGWWCHRRPDGSDAAVEVAVTTLEGGAVLVVAHDGRAAGPAPDAAGPGAELARQATHDPLTGLPNRVLLMDRLTQALARAARDGTTVGVMFCDLDRFKVVNDSLGHSAGDQLLIAIADRLRAAVRPGDTVARFGGDEFVVLCEQLDGAGTAEVIAGRLLAGLRDPVVVDSGELVVSGSVGIAVADGAGATAEEVVRDADAAMYRAKERGRDRYEIFDAALRERAVDRLLTERALRRALSADELLVHYQPALDLTSDRVTGVEALVRWRDPDRGLLLPDRFIGIAEETGLIVPLGEEVLRLACAEAATWPAGLDGEPAPVLWVNLSPRQLIDPGIVDVVRDVGGALLAERRLGLEVTESSLVPDDDRVTGALQALSDIGVQVAIDDFGTGFASLAYLWRFPADVLKVDRSFVAGLGRERSATVIVASIVQLARTLDRTTVAEGVESAGQLAQIRRLGCDQIQGWLYGRAVPGDELRDLLADPPDLAAQAAAQSSDEEMEGGWARP